MKNNELTFDNDLEQDSWDDDNDFMLLDKDIESGDIDLTESVTDLSAIGHALTARRMQGLRKGLTARHMIEELKEQRALSKELADFDDYEYLN